VLPYATAALPSPTVLRCPLQHASDINAPPSCAATCWDKATRTYYEITSKRVTRYDYTCCCCENVENVYLVRRPQLSSRCDSVAAHAPLTDRYLPASQIHVFDIKWEQSCLDCLACTGTIIIYSSDKTAPELRIEGLPGAREIFQTLLHEVGHKLEYTTRHVD
jgi:hypothetical protein